MDYYNFNPDFEDSLAFLSPAAQRNSGLTRRVLSPDYFGSEDVQYLRNQFSYNQDYQKPSSTSLVLKKRKDREIIEQYYNENIRYRPYPSPKLSKPIQNAKHRPLIRVTVIPNNNTSTQTKLRKHRSSAKKIQSSVSNHETFFKAKNIFLVVGGNKREKIYEIKTTGSEYSSTRYAKDEQIPVEQNYQQLLSSLNMDKKKKKDKGKGKRDKDKMKAEESKMEDRTSAGSLMDIMEGSDGARASLLRECICSPPMETVSPRKSRVRITGKIGLTEDDRYVLKCAATIDGKPVETNFFQEQIKSPLAEREAQEIREIPRVCMPMSCSQREKMTQKGLPRVSQRDEMIQTNMQNEESYREIYPCPAFKNTCPVFVNTCPAFRNVETQCSPHNVNTVCFSNIEKLKIFSSKDEVVQCSCPQDLIINTKNSPQCQYVETDYDNNAYTPKSCNSPLVIISVYPKQDSDEKLDDESSVKNGNSSPPLKEKDSGNKKIGRSGSKKKGKGSRSPSPAPKGKVKEEKKVEKPKGKGKGKEKGDKPVKGKKGTKKEKPEQDEKKSEFKSPERRQSATQFGIQVGRCAECCMGCRGSRGGQENKQAGQFATNRLMNWVSAKSDVSNVAVNIDGENEFYDVSFRQGDITTDLQVRKTLKDTQDSKQGAEVSLANYFVPDGMGTAKKKTISDTYVFNQPNADLSEHVDNTIPRINVRDSIEISHRREERDSSNSMILSSTSSTNSASNTKLAPIKHYQGDNCDLSNPVERDKEIRELLGIEKTKTNISRYYEEFAAKAEVDCECSLHCFYRRQRKTHVSTIGNIHELRRLYVDDAVTQASNDDLVDYMDEQMDNDDDVYKDIDRDLCRDSEILIAHTQPAYGCPLQDKCKNRKVPCENSRVSILKTEDTDQNRQSDFYNPGKSRVSNLRRSTRPSNKRKLCIPEEPGSKPCGVIVQCPYDHEYETKEDFEVDPRISGANRQSELQHSDTNVGGPPEPSRDTEGIIIPCPYKASIRKSSLKDKDRNESEYDVLDDEDQNRKSSTQNPPLYQQLILNRNINIYLQIEQFKKQKPIILSRKQYEKVKRTIEGATAKKNNCICKGQSSSRVSGEIKRKSTERKWTEGKSTGGRSIDRERRFTKLPSTSPSDVKKSNELEKEVAHKRVQCECDELPKDKKKRFTWGKNKSKKKKSDDVTNQEAENPPSRLGCTSNVSFVSSNNEAFRKASKASVDDEADLPTPRRTRISKPHVDSNKYYYEHKSRKSRMSSAERRYLEENRKYSTTCCNIPQPEVVISNGNEEDAVIYDGDIKKSKNTKISLDRNDIENGEENQNRSTKHSQYRETEKTKLSRLNNEDSRFYEDHQRKHSKKSKLSKNSKLNDEERKSRKISSRVSGAGDETFNQKESIDEHRRSSKRRERENEALREASSHYICCRPVVIPPDDGGVIPKRESTIVIKPPPETFAPASSQVQHHCKRCGRLKQLHSCGNCGRLNGGCLHTCYCYELQEENPEPSVKHIFFNKFAQDKQYPASSTEVRYTSVIYANYKHVTFSSTNIANDNVMPSVPNLLTKNYNSNSLHTIFKGRRRTPTPNLGTSAYSLYSDYSDATSINKLPQPLQERKPFLRRLMSCLVMRSKTSNIKIDCKPITKIPSVNSSVDSYHINTSLGAIELSSSIYDTSASFYSNHSIQPISSKIIKRGFLSSVRGFLTNRKT